MALDSFLKRCQRTIAAGESVKIPGTGEKIFVELANIAFQVQPEDRIPIDLKRRVRIHTDPFRNLTIFNTSATKTLYVTLWIGRGEVDMDEISLPSTELLGESVPNLVDNGNQVFVGTDATGRQREYLVITLRPGVAGRVELYSNQDASLIGIVAAGAAASNGIAFKTDHDVKLVNKTGGVLDNTGGVKDIAVAQAWLS